MGNPLDRLHRHKGGWWGRGFPALPSSLNRASGDIRVLDYGSAISAYVLSLYWFTVRFRWKERDERTAHERDDSARVPCWTGRPLGTTGAGQRDRFQRR